MVGGGWVVGGWWVGGWWVVSEKVGWLVDGGGWWLVVGGW